jgi:hypothetical protein
MAALSMEFEPRGTDPAASAAEITPAEPDLIDRIAGALPEEIRAEYYRELRHCRLLPENDEMLRLLRAMQFLVLLIEQAPTRVADERSKLEKLLTTAVERISSMSAASETYHNALQHQLTVLPFEVARGIRPEHVAGQINEKLEQEFLRSTIPQTADALGEVADRIKKVCSEFSAASDALSHEHRGASEDARKAVASLKAEVSQAMAGAALFRSEVEGKFAKSYQLSLAMIASGALVLGLAIGMMLERWVLSPPQPVVQPAATVVQTEPEPAKQTPPLAKPTPPAAKSAIPK